MKKIDGILRLTILLREPLEERQKKIIDKFMESIDEKEERFLLNKKNLILESKNFEPFWEKYDMIEKFFKSENMSKKSLLELSHIFEMGDIEGDVFSRILSTSLGELCEEIMSFTFFYTEEEYVCLVDINKNFNNELLITVKDTIDETTDVSNLYNKLENVLEKLVQRF